MPVALQLAQQLEDRPLGRGVDAREGLVHEVEIGLLRQRPRQEDALLLAARELADLALGEAAHAHRCEAAQRDLAVGRVGRRNSACLP